MTFENFINEDKILKYHLASSKYDFKRNHSDGALYYSTEIPELSDLLRSSKIHSITLEADIEVKKNWFKTGNQEDFDEIFNNTKIGISEISLKLSEIKRAYDIDDFSLFIGFVFLLDNNLFRKHLELLRTLNIDERFKPLPGITSGFYLKGREILEFFKTKKFEIDLKNLGQDLFNTPIFTGRKISGVFKLKIR